MRTLALRAGFGFFALYLAVMCAAMISPSVFTLVMGLVGLRPPDVPSPEHRLVLNMALCGCVPAAFMAARAAARGGWTAGTRAFWLVSLGGNLAANAITVTQAPAMTHVLAGDTALVLALLALAATSPATAR